MVVHGNGGGGVTLTGSEHGKELLVLCAVAFCSEICVGSVVSGHTLGVTAPLEC